jgi:hypothetical protein
MGTAFGITSARRSHLQGRSCNAGRVLIERPQVVLREAMVGMRRRIIFFLFPEREHEIEMRYMIYFQQP